MTTGRARQALGHEQWTVTDAAETYEIARWGKGYFSVGENGHVRVHPTKEPARWIDLKELVDRRLLFVNMCAVKPIGRIKIREHGCS